MYQSYEELADCLHPSHTTGGTSCSYRFYSAAEPPPRLPHIFQDLVYPFTLQAECPAVVRIGQNSPVMQQLSEVSMRACDTVAKCPIPPLTLCRLDTQKHARVITLYTPWTKPSVTVAKNSFANAQILKLPWNTQDIGHFATVSKVPYKPQTVVSGTGAFRQASITMGYTAWHITGVLNCQNIQFIIFHNVLVQSVLIL